MKYFCPTIVVRHRKEKLKKCSLRGLESRDDFQFYTYPLKTALPIENYVLLTVDAPQVLSKEDSNRGLLLLDATWRLAEKMESVLSLPPTVVRRSLPNNILTAYPRRQEEKHGLASIEALYISYLLTGRNVEGLLNSYFWKELFLEKNPDFSIMNS